MISKLSRGAASATCAIISTSLFLGCSGAPDRESARAAEAPIIQGDGARLGTEGVLRIRTRFSDGEEALCTGTALFNNWVLTAKHCFRSNGGARPTGTIVDSDGGEESSRKVYEHPTRDVALVRLSAPLPVGGSAINFERVLSALDPLTLVGASVQCFGYGDTYVGGGDDSLHSATLAVASAGDGKISFLPNARGQIQGEGDSGGPCFFDNGASREVISVLATVTLDASGRAVLSSESVAVNSIRDWARDVMAGTRLDAEVAPASATSSRNGAPPALAVDGERIDVFVRTFDNRLAHKYRATSNDAWLPSSGFEPVPLDGNELRSAPAAVYSAPGNVSVFFRGSDNAVWRVRWTGAAWERTSLGGSVVSAPAAVSWGPDRVDVFAVGTDYRLYHQVIDHDLPSGRWTALGAQTIKDGFNPVAISRAPNRIDVVAVGSDGAPKYIGYSPGAYLTHTIGPFGRPITLYSDTSAWIDLHGYVTSDPALTRVNDTSFEMVARGGGALGLYAMRLQDDPNATISSGGWEYIGLDGSGGTPALVTSPLGQEVYAMKGMTLWHRHQNPTGGWLTWQKTSAYSAFSPSATSSPFSHAEVFFADGDGTIWNRDDGTYDLIAN